MAALLLCQGAHPDTPTKTGLTALHMAAQEDRVAIAEILREHEADLDPCTKMGYTPLIVACHYGNVKMVNFLLQHGANVDATTKSGYTPLHQAAQQGNTHIINVLLQHGARPNTLTVNGNTALDIARRLGYISVVDTLKVVTEEVITKTTTVTEKHKLNVPETMTEMLDVSDEEGEDTMTGEGGEYLRPEDLQDLGDDSLPGQYLEGMNYMHISLDAVRSDSLRSFGSDRSQPPLRHHGYLSKDIKLMEGSQEMAMLSVESCGRSWGTEHPDNITSSPFHSGRSSPYLDQDNSSFLVSFMVDARGGAMRGCRHNGLRIIIPPRKCSAPTRVTCRLVKRHRVATMPPLVEGDGTIPGVRDTCLLQREIKREKGPPTVEKKRESERDPLTAKKERERDSPTVKKERERLTYCEERERETHLKLREREGDLIHSEPVALSVSGWTHFPCSDIMRRYDSRRMAETL
ncbi:hypothetical protein JZ751_028609 [Albula glossodonta]|uniref:ZU5 domain-containing protein n=1 Tax=Albula glossodonta TaxID=121402 RepID=A0A8T2MWS0_9TELE|nr:hypothetical protein JZ751_028609 [Albula glossodonta]